MKHTTENCLFETDRSLSPYTEIALSKIKQLTADTNRRPNVYLLTTTFLPNSDPNPAYYLNLFETAYRRLLRHLIPVRTYRQKHKQPTTLAFFDLPHTSYYKHQRIQSENLPHIHAIVIVHPDTQTNFDRLTRSDFATNVLLRSMLNTAVYRHCRHRSTINTEYPYNAIRSIDIRPVRRSIADLDKTVKYSSKLLSDPYHKHKHEMLDLMLPVPKAPSIDLPARKSIEIANARVRRHLSA